MNRYPIAAGFEAAGKSAVGGFILGLFLLFGITKSFMFGAAIGIAVGVGIIGFIVGYRAEKSPTPLNHQGHYPGLAPNLHPYGSTAWYQHEQLMLAEREAEARRQGDSS